MTVARPTALGDTMTPRLTIVPQHGQPQPPPVMVSPSAATEPSALFRGVGPARATNGKSRSGPSGAALELFVSERSRSRDRGWAHRLLVWAFSRPDRREW